MAAEAFRKLAEQGNARAQNNLAVMCIKEDVICMDKNVQAYMWLNRAAQQGLTGVNMAKLREIMTSYEINRALSAKPDDFKLPKIRVRVQAIPNQ